MAKSASSLDSTALADLRNSFGGDVVLPGDPDYDGARVVWNALADRHPAMIARCTGSGDVASALRWAREQDLAIAVRGGGHSVAGFSTCDDGIVIDLSPMRRVEVDVERGVARTEGGALLGQLDAAAQAFGLACPVGVVSHTGVAGLTLGGGMGRLQRKFGFTVDNLLSVDLIAADGRTVHASEDENADLFWGLRGAGANFGIATAFEFRLHPVGPIVTQGMAAYPVDRALDAAGMFRELAASGPDELMLSLGFGVATEDLPVPPEMIGAPVVMLGATHCGSVEQAERDVGPLRGLDPLVDTFGPKPYLEVQAMFDETDAWGKRFYMKGAYLEGITEGFVDRCVENVTGPSGECSIVLWAFGGAIARVPDDAMAFTGRHAGFWLGVEAMWEDPALDDAHRSWGRTTMEALKPFTTAGHYVNDMVESGEAVVRSIYGDAKYERLVALKRAHDPDNVFRLNQNIAP